MIVCPCRCVLAGEPSDLDYPLIELPRWPLAVMADGNAKLNHYTNLAALLQRSGCALTQVIRFVAGIVGM